MPDDNEISPESGDDEVLDKLDALLRKHQSKPSAVAGSMADVDGAAASLPVLTQILDAAPEQSSPPALNQIPTLTEAIPLPPATPSPRTEVTSQLRQLLDAALEEAGTDLDFGAREALIRALEWRLKNL